MRQTVGVLGLGVFGRTIVKELTTEDADIIAVDMDSVLIQRMEPYALEAIIGDFTDIDLMESIGLNQCHTVVIATASSLESSVIATLNCKKMGIKNIIVKVKNKYHKEIMEALGATEVVRPEYSAGIKLAKQLRNPHIRDIINLGDGVAIVEFVPPSKWIGQSITSLDLRSEFGINIIGIKSEESGAINYEISVDEPLQSGDMLVAIGKQTDIEAFDYVDH